MADPKRSAENGFVIWRDYADFTNDQKQADKVGIGIRISPRYDVVVEDYNRSEVKEAADLNSKIIQYFADHIGHPHAIANLRANLYTLAKGMLGVPQNSPDFSLTNQNLQILSQKLRDRAERSGNLYAAAYTWVMGALPEASRGLVRNRLGFVDESFANAHAKMEQPGNAMRSLKEEAIQRLNTLHATALKNEADYKAMGAWDGQYKIPHVEGAFFSLDYYKEFGNHYRSAAENFVVTLVPGANPFRFVHNVTSDPAWTKKSHGEILTDIQKEAAVTKGGGLSYTLYLLLHRHDGKAAGPLTMADVQGVEKILKTRANTRSANPTEQGFYAAALSVFPRAVREAAAENGETAEFRKAMDAYLKGKGNANGPTREEALKKEGMDILNRAVTAANPAAPASPPAPATPQAAPAQPTPPPAAAAKPAPSYADIMKAAEALFSFGAKYKFDPKERKAVEEVLAGWNIRTPAGGNLSPHDVKAVGFWHSNLEAFIDYVYDNDKTAYTGISLNRLVANISSPGGFKLSEQEAQKLRAALAEKSDHNHNGDGKPDKIFAANRAGEIADTLFSTLQKMGKIDEKVHGTVNHLKGAFLLSYKDHTNTGAQAAANNYKIDHDTNWHNFSPTLDSIAATYAAVILASGGMGKALELLNPAAPPVAPVVYTAAIDPPAPEKPAPPAPPPPAAAKPPAKPVYTAAVDTPAPAPRSVATATAVAPVKDRLAVEPKIMDIQAFLKLDDKNENEVVWIDGKHGPITKPRVAALMQSVKTNAAFQTAYPGIETMQTVDQLHEFLLKRLREDLCYRNFIAGQAFETRHPVLDAHAAPQQANPVTAGKEQTEEIKAAQVMINNFILLNSRGAGFREFDGIAALKVDGKVKKEDDAAFAALQKFYDREHAVAVCAPGAAKPADCAPDATAAQKLRELQEESQRLTRELDVARRDNNALKQQQNDLSRQLEQERTGREAAERELERQRALSEQFRSSALDNDTWMNTVRRTKSLADSKSDAALVSKYCKFFQSSRAERMGEDGCVHIEHAGMTKEDMLRGLLHIDERGHVIFLRVAEQALSPGSKRHALLAYDITDKINDLKGIDTVRFTYAAEQNVNNAYEISLAKANKSRSGFDANAGILVQREADVRCRNPRYYIQAADTNGNGHADRIRLITADAYDKDKTAYSGAWSQTPESIRDKKFHLEHVNDPSFLQRRDIGFSDMDEVQRWAHRAAAAAAAGGGGAPVPAAAGRAVR